MTEGMAAYDVGPGTKPSWTETTETQYAVEFCGVIAHASSVTAAREWSARWGEEARVLSRQVCRRVTSWEVVEDDA